MILEKRREKKHIYTKVYIFIYLYSFEGDMARRKSVLGRRPFFDIEPLHLNKEISNTPGPKPKEINHTSLRVVLDKVMKFSEK